MKKSIFIFFLVATILSCRKDKTTDVQPVNVNVQLAYNLSASTYQLPLDDISVKFTNLGTGNVISAKTNEAGLVSFNKISPGTYDIDASTTISAATYTEITGVFTDKDMIFNASIKTKQINIGFSELVKLDLFSGKVSDWVIKQVYYAGSDRTDGALYRDQFIEIYNNSDKVLYADSLFIGEITGVVSLPNTTYNLLSSNQMDWSKAVGMPTNINPNTDYVYTRALLLVPGTGTQHPVEPGKSIVIAQTGLNHKSPFIGNNGKTISVNNPSLTIDLSGADFEAYYGDVVSGSKLASDVDTPVPNMIPIQIFGKDMIFDNPGRYSYIVGKWDGITEVKDLPNYPYPTKTTPGSTATKYFQIPNAIILDAVEIEPNLAEDRIPKKIHPSLDAGYTFVPAGSYTSQSVIRKTLKTENGRVILKDTNNSSEDFDFLDRANPRGFK